MQKVLNVYLKIIKEKKLTRKVTDIESQCHWILKRKQGH